MIWSDLTEFKKQFSDKTALVIGLGKFGGGLGAVKFLAGICKKVLVCDLKAPEEFTDIVEDLQQYKNVELKFGRHEKKDFENKDLIVLNPSVMLHSEIYQWAKQTQAPIETEITLFFKLSKGIKIGVTGTCGKSTFASLLAHILKYSDKKCFLGGNIGGSLFPNIEQINDKDFVVLEISSFQLQYFAEDRLAPYVGIILNIYPDHLDKHLNFQEYVNAKINLIRFQNKNQFSIFSPRDDNTYNFSNFTNSNIFYFSKEKEVKCGSFLCDDMIYFANNSVSEKVIDIRQIRNPAIAIDTLLAIVACAKVLGVSNTSIHSAIDTFKGLEHRLELVGEYKGRKFINDSNATTPQASIFGLELIKAPKIVISGGKNKNIDYSLLCKKLAQEAKAIILIGETSNLFYDTIKKFNSNAKIVKSNSLKEAVISAYNLSDEGDYIILSPGTSSFDMFANFVERGNAFKREVKEIIDGRL